MRWPHRPGAKLSSDHPGSFFLQHPWVFPPACFIVAGQEITEDHKLSLKLALKPSSLSFEKGDTDCVNKTSGTVSKPLSLARLWTDDLLLPTQRKRSSGERTPRKTLVEAGTPKCLRVPFRRRLHFFPEVLSPQEMHLNFLLFTWLSPNATGKEFYKVLENSVVWKFHRTTFLKICQGLFIILSSGPWLWSLSLTRERDFFSRVFGTHSNQNCLNWGQDTPGLFWIPPL